MHRKDTTRPERTTGLNAVAQVAGVSASTVSRALRDDQRISAATRERVKAVARELGYAPDRGLAEELTRAAHRRSAKHQHAVAILDDLSRDDGRFRCTELCAGAANFAATFGYEVSTHDISEPGTSFVDYAGVLLSDYVLMAEGFHGWVREYPGVAIAIEPNSMCCELDAVLGNHWAAMFHVLDELTARGYGHPGLVMAQGTDRSSGFQWGAAYNAWHQAQGRALVPPYRGGRCAGDARALAGWVVEHDIDVVVSRKSVRAVIEATGLNIDFVNLGVRSEASRTSGLLQNYRRLGDEALRLLDSRLRTRRPGEAGRPLMILVDHVWHEGDSVRPRGTGD